MKTEIPTFDQISQSAKFIKIPKKEECAPLPCESNNTLASDNDIIELAKRFPVLDMSFMQTTYYDKKLKHELPVFAAVNVASGSISTNRIRGLARKINPKLLAKRPILGESKSLIDCMPTIILSSFALLCLGLMIQSNIVVISSTVIMTISLLGSIICDEMNYHKESPPIIDYIYNFSGSIPNDVRALYYQEKDNFDNVYLICDAQNRWTAEERPLPPPNPDPLMIGIKNLGQDKYICFLLAKFDLTARESYISKEFTVG